MRMIINDAYVIRHWRYRYISSRTHNNLSELLTYLLAFLLDR